jgi:hypothetical protein
MRNYKFINNKYTRWYFNIIYKAADIKIPHETNHHHVLPESLFPEYKTLSKHNWNGVHLTHREHFICHRLLTKMTEGKAKRKMCYAVWRLANSKDTSVLTARTYAVLREQISLETTGIDYNERYGQKRANEMKQKISESHARKKRQPMMGKFHSDETKQKISKANTGIPRPKSEETKKKMSETWKLIAPDHSGEKNPMYGNTQTEETKKLISNANKGENNGMFGKYKNAATLECPHCNKSGKDGPNFIRWHFDNCKGKL